MYKNWLLFVRTFLRWYPRESSPTIALSAIRNDWIHLSSCDTSKVRQDEAVFSAFSPREVQLYTRSPFVPCLLWLALSVVETSNGMRVGSIGSINSVHCLVIHLFVFEVQRLNLFSWSNSHNRKENTRRFPPEIITFVLISWPRYTSPHSINSVTRLLASLTQFRYLLLAVFPLKALCIHRFPEMKLTVKFKTDGPELSATDASNLFLW